MLATPRRSPPRRRGLPQACGEAPWLPSLRASSRSRPAAHSCRPSSRRLSAAPSCPASRAPRRPLQMRRSTCRRAAPPGRWPRSSPRAAAGGRSSCPASCPSTRPTGLRSIRSPAGLDDPAALAPPIPPLERRLILTHLIQRWSAAVDRDALRLGAGRAVPRAVLSRRCGGARRRSRSADGFLHDRGRALGQSLAGGRDRIFPVFRDHPPVRRYRQRAIGRASSPIATRATRRRGATRSCAPRRSACCGTGRMGRSSPPAPPARCRRPPRSLPPSRDCRTAPSFCPASTPTSMRRAFGRSPAARTAAIPFPAIRRPPCSGSLPTICRSGATR